MSDYPSVMTISERLPYTARALGFDDESAYDAVLEDLREEEIERIEEWGSVITDSDSAEALFDGSNPRTAFEMFDVTNDVDGRAAVRTPREVDRTRQRRHRRHSDERFDDDRKFSRHREGKRRRTLPLPGRPVDEVESVELLERDTDLEMGEDVFVDQDALILDRHAPLREWPQGRRNVRVEYAFGNDGAPARIRDTLIDLVHIRLMKDQSLPVESESIDGDSSSYRDAGELLASAFGTVLSETEESHRGGVFSI